MRLLLVHFAVICVYACGAIFMSGLAWGGYLISQSAPSWVFAAFCFSGIVVALGLASLLDQVKPLTPQKPHGQ